MVMSVLVPSFADETANLMPTWLNQSLLLFAAGRTSRALLDVSGGA
jgi:hypothetical protein